MWPNGRRCLRADPPRGITIAETLVTNGIVTVEQLREAFPEQAQVSMDINGYGALVAEAITRPWQDVTSIETTRAKTRRSAVQQHCGYHARLRIVQTYRAGVPRFNELCFRDPVRAAVTPGKVVVQRPSGLSDDDEFDLLQRRLEIPFAEFNARCNRSLEGRRGGVMELCESIADHLLEGGLCGYAVSFEDRRIGGLTWRMPKDVQLYGGGVMATSSLIEMNPWSQFTADTGPAEWYAHLGPLTVFDGTQPLVVDPKDTRLWYHLADNPASGLYAGVWSVEHPIGSLSNYPTPPYASLFDQLLALDLLTKDDLSTMAFNQRHVVLWKFDFEAMQKAGHAWNDVTQPDGTVKLGAVSIFRDRRQQMITQQTGSVAENFLPGYITYEEHRPGLELLQAIKKYQPFEANLDAVAGLFYDPSGLFMKEESTERIAVDFHWLREQVLEVCIQRIYDAIVSENKRWFGVLNGTPGFDPFHWESSAWRRRNQVAKTVGDAQRRREREVKLLLDGAISDIGVQFEFVPSPNSRDQRAQLLSNGALRGLNSIASYHEALGMDPDLERRRMRVQRTSDVMPVDSTTEPLWMGPISFVQKTTGGGGADQTTGSVVSPGRTPGTPAAMEEPALPGLQLD